jgi:hypothetical protein
VCHQTDVDVVVRRILHNVALREGCRSCPVSAICAQLLCHGKFAAAVEREDFVGAISSRNSELGRGDGVRLGRFDRARKFLIVLLHHEGQAIQSVFHEIGREGVVRNKVKLLHQVLLTQDGDRLTRCRRSAHSNVAAAFIANTANSVISRDDLDCLSASGRANDYRQVVLIENLEAIGKDSCAAIAVV